MRDATDQVPWWATLDTNQKGLIAEAKVLARAAELGWAASVTQAGARYDLVLDDGQRLYRAQVKWAGQRRAAGGAVVALTTWQGNGRDRPRGKQRRYADGEIDVVVAYIPMIDQLCWFDGEHLTKTAIHIRHAPAANGQTHGVLMADDFVWTAQGNVGRG